MACRLLNARSRRRRSGVFAARKASEAWSRQQLQEEYDANLRELQGTGGAGSKGGTPWQSPVLGSLGFSSPGANGVRMRGKGSVGSPGGAGVLVEVVGEGNGKKRKNAGGRSPGGK